MNLSDCECKLYSFKRYCQSSGRHKRESLKSQNLLSIKFMRLVCSPSYKTLYLNKSIGPTFLMRYYTIISCRHFVYISSLQQQCFSNCSHDFKFLFPMIFFRDAQGSPSFTQHYLLSPTRILFGSTHTRILLRHIIYLCLHFLEKGKNNISHCRVDMIRFFRILTWAISKVMK